MMKGLKNIRSLITESSVTLFWEREEYPAGGIRYEIYLDKILAGTSDKTHYKLKGLMPEQEYTVQVKAVCGTETEVSHELHLITGQKKKFLDITKAPYYAAGDGKLMNTEAIQRAIDDCTQEDAVYIPEGIFLTGALRLHSDMELYLEEGAVLQGTDRPEDYLPRIWSRFEGTELECYSSLLNMGVLDHKSGYNCRNVVIRGKGTIASGGAALAKNIIDLERENLKDYLAALGDKIAECEKPETIPGRVRPRLINISNCQNIIISGLDLKNGASWNVHMIYSDNIVTEGCTFYSGDVWNGDGWDPDSSRNCVIFGCTFYTGDDSISIKSGKNPEGNDIRRPCEHIRIFDCKSEFGHGITIGSEMSGGINDVAIWDCDMSASLCGIEIKGTKKRGGYVRNVTVRNCSVARILFHSVGYNDDGIAASKPPIFEKCIFENIHILGRYIGHNRKWASCDAIELCGFDESGHELKDIIFRDIKTGSRDEKSRQTISLQFCENITFERFSNIK